MKKLSFRQSWLARRSFRKLAGPDRLIDYPEWKKALTIKSDLFAKRLFDLVDTDHSAYIDQSEFLKFIETVQHPDIRRRLSFVFKMYDIDNDGILSRQEIKQVLSASLKEQNLNLAEANMTSLVNAFIKATDSDGDRAVSKKDFVSTISKIPGIQNQFNQFVSHWIVSRKKPKRSNLSQSAPLLNRTKRFIAQRWSAIFWSLAYLAANAYCFINAMSAYSDSSLAVQIARGGGACLYLNTALILIPVCHSIWSLVRRSALKILFPVDYLIAFHKTIAISIGAFTLVHIGAHFYNYWYNQDDIFYVLVFTPIGLTGLIITAIIYAMSNGYFSKDRNREYFAITHSLYGVFIVGLLFHGEDFWLWLLPSSILLGTDAFIRYFFKTRSLKISRLKALSDGVSYLMLEKPKRLNFNPGDYLRIRIPAISNWQWHPFTISAAPEGNQFAIHVRNNGDWSGALHNISQKSGFSAKGLKATIDGPYSAPASDISQAKVAILIAAGIGVTPFASVLQSLLFKEKKKRNNNNADQTIYFHWLNRSQSSYDWFLDLLHNAENKLGQDKFRLFIHLTSLSHNLTNIAMQVAIDAYREKHKRDPLTSLTATTGAGRPNWDKLFYQVAQEHPNKQVDVFFCGPPALGKTLKRVAKHRGFYYHEEQFE